MHFDGAVQLLDAGYRAVSAKVGRFRQEVLRIAEAHGDVAHGSGPHVICAPLRPWLKQRHARLVECVCGDHGNQGNQPLASRE
jgi:hypothetical protein